MSKIEYYAAIKIYLELYISDDSVIPRIFVQ